MKRNWIRSLCLVLVLTTFLLMAIGSGSSKKSETKDIVDATSAQAGNNDEQETEESTKAKSSDVTIDEQVLVDQDGVKITATEMENDSIFGMGINLLIENSTDKDIMVKSSALIVNDYMISELLYSDIAAGKKANETMSLASNALEAAGIKNIGQIEIYFVVSDADSYDTIFSSDCVTIKTSDFDKMVIQTMDDGKELVNQDGIRIVANYVDENSFWGAGVLLFIENKSGKNVSIDCEEMSINGFMVSPLFSSTVYDGKMAVSTITIFKSDLEDNKITSVDEIEVTFKAYDLSTFDTVFETDPIVFAAK